MNYKNYKISIIIPTYNRADYVIQTIQSVFQQHLENYEIIVVDDGSTDNTKKILEVFFKLPNFQYIYQKNSGRSVARNVGMENALGEYLMFLDSDDLLDPDALKILCDTFQQFPESDIVVGERKFIDENEKLIYLVDPIKVKREYFAEYIHLEKVRELFFPPSTYIVKKQIAQAVKGFDRSMEPAEDFDFFIKCCDICKISIVKKTVVFMRRHEGNTPEEMLRKATIKIGIKNFDYLNSNPQLYEATLLRKMKALWQVRIADDYYFINQKKESFKHYWKSVTISPALLVNAHVSRQLIAALLPEVFIENVKYLLGYLRNSKKNP